MQQGKFIKNTMILTVTAFLIRGMGILFRIWMAAKVGAQGMGLYQLVFSVYVLAHTAGAGLPPALMNRLAALPDDRSRMRPVALTSVLAAAIACLSGGAFFLLSDFIATCFLAEGTAALSIRIFCFSLPCMAVSAVIRGYFITGSNTVIPSSAQILEQIIRIGIVMFLLLRLGQTDLGSACAAIILGDTIAEFCSCAFYLGALGLHNRKLTKAPGATLEFRTLICTSAPITGSRYLSTLLHSAENMLIPWCLSAYAGTAALGIAAFGELKGMTIPLLFFPASFLSSVSTLLLPEISADYAKGNMQGVRRSAGRVVELTLLLSIPIAGGFWLYGPALGQLLYHSQSVGNMMRVLSPIVPFMYLESVCDGILKGMTQQAHSFLYNLCDSVFRISAILLLVPRYGLPGFLGIMIFSNMFTSSMNIRRLLKVAGLRLQLWQEIFRPLLLTAVSGGAAWLAAGLLPAGWPTTIGGLSILCVGYGLLNLPRLRTLRKGALRRKAAPCVHA